MKKTHNLAVKVGSYEKDGETKNRYENIGAVMKGEHGPFIFLKKTFNPAGIDTENSDIIVSIFPVEKNEEKKDATIKNPFSDDTIPF